MVLALLARRKGRILAPYTGVDRIGCVSAEKHRSLAQCEAKSDAAIEQCAVFPQACDVLLGRGQASE